MKGLLFTYLLTYGGALTALFRPYVGLLVYVAFAILRPETLWGHSVPAGGRYSLIVALALLAGWAAKRFGSWRFGRARGIVVALIGYWIWLYVSAAVAPNGPRMGVRRRDVEGLLAMPCRHHADRLDAETTQLAWVIVLCQGYLAFEFNQQYYAVKSSPRSGTSPRRTTTASPSRCRPRSAWRSFWDCRHCGGGISRWRFWSGGADGPCGPVLDVAEWRLWVWWGSSRSSSCRSVRCITRCSCWRSSWCSVWRARRSPRSSAPSSRTRSTAMNRRGWDRTDECLDFGDGPESYRRLGARPFPPQRHLYGFPRGKAGHNTWGQVGADDTRAWPLT